jgi:polar amino acid transport system permease protein
VIDGSPDPPQGTVVSAPRRSLRRSRGVTVLIATVSTLVVLLVVGWAVVNSSGWPRVQRTYFDAEQFVDAVPSIVRAFWLNVQIFIVAEILILIWALVLASMRSLKGPVFFPVRAFAILYIDLFRGLPSIIVIYLLGFGIPALRLPGVPNDVFFWGVVSLVLVWSAYVAEVYRAGIESIHPSQEAAARSLGLSGFQAFRYVVLPQAVRRVIPPLLNDAVGLQKDTALVSFLGPVEAFRRAQVIGQADFNFTPYVVSALLFLALTVPAARLVDWLIARDRRRYLAGAQ